MIDEGEKQRKKGKKAQRQKKKILQILQWACFQPYQEGPSQRPIDCTQMKAFFVFGIMSRGIITRRENDHPPHAEKSKRMGQPIRDGQARMEDEAKRGQATKNLCFEINM